MIDYSGLWVQLKKNGWNTTRIRAEGLIGEATLTAIRAGNPIGGKTIERLCSVLGCQPGDLMQCIKEEGQSRV